VLSDGVLERVAAADPPPRAAILDFGPVFDVDSTGSAALADLKRTLDDRGVELYVVRATASVRELMRRDGVVAAIGEDRLLQTMRDAVAAVERSGSQGTARGGPGGS
jgi:SulP family sulfate permease